MNLLFTKEVNGKIDNQLNTSLYLDENLKNTKLKFDLVGLSEIKEKYGIT